MFGRFEWVWRGLDEGGKRIKEEIAVKILWRLAAPDSTIVSLSSVSLPRLVSLRPWIGKFVSPRLIQYPPGEGGVSEISGPEALEPLN